MDLQHYQEEASKHRSYHDQEYHDHEQNLNYLEDREGCLGSRGVEGGEVGGCYRGEEYKNGETAGYNGFENGEINYNETKRGYKEAEYDGSNFEDSTDLEYCQYQEKEEKVMVMVSMVMVMEILVSKLVMTVAFLTQMTSSQSSVFGVGLTKPITLPPLC